MQIRILLAEDQAIVRGGFRALVEAEQDMEVIGEVSSGEHAVGEARRLAPDVVLMDIRMPGMDGIRATELITADPSCAATRVLVLTTFELDEYVFGALRAGASGFLLKGGEPAELLHAIRTVAAGNSLLAPSVTRRLIEAYTARPEPRQAPPELAELTEREREVLALVAAGQSNAEIAASLHVSPLTAKTHISRILGKLGRRDRVQLVVLAYQTGLVGPGAGS
ncbi:MAG TPA: response regulator transcription factor [Solirubrobacteraceae bacterium]|jgi:DNA-binding NarL/FixJ family response regulator|nr:response regulator transcription factor [Solirubrobacteraceae bacterium]